MAEYPTHLNFRSDRERRAKRRRKLLMQRLLGIVLLACTVLFVSVCAAGNEDCGAGLITGILGLVLLLSKNILIM